MREIFLEGQRGTMTALRGGDPAGPKLLALHGWLDNAASFLPLAPQLPAFDLVALDLPGHGGSAHRAAGYDYVFVDWIHDVLDALDALDWPHAHLLGHSMGGAIATLVAVAAPTRVDKLALIEALGPIAGRASEAATRLAQAVAMRRALLPGKSPRVIAKLEDAVNARLAATPMSRDAARLIVSRNLRAVDDGHAWRSDPRLMLPAPVRTDEAFIQDWLGAIKATTLVIAADPPPSYFGTAVRDARVAMLHDGHQISLPGSHHLHMEQPAIVGPLLGEFLRCGGR